MNVSNYQGYLEWKSWQKSPFGIFDREMDSYFYAEISRTGLSMDGLRVLEIGFGNGEFAGWAKRYGANYTGLEVIPELVEKACQCGFTAHVAHSDLNSLFQPESFDLVVAFDVFEHLSLDELQTLLGKFTEILSPSGRILARFPSGDSPYARYFQNGDLTHKSSLGSGIIRRLAADGGYDVCGIHDQALPLAKVGLAKFFKRVLVKATRFCFYRFTSHVLMGIPAAVISPNMVVVLRRR